MKEVFVIEKLVTFGFWELFLANSTQMRERP